MCVYTAALCDCPARMTRDRSESRGARPAKIAHGKADVGNALRVTVRDERAGIRTADLYRICGAGFIEEELGEADPA